MLFQRSLLSSAGLLLPLMLSAALAVLHPSGATRPPRQSPPPTRPRALSANYSPRLREHELGRFTVIFHIPFFCAAPAAYPIQRPCSRKAQERSRAHGIHPWRRMTYPWRSLTSTASRFPLRSPQRHRIAVSRDKSARGMMNADRSGTAPSVRHVAASARWRPTTSHSCTAVACSRRSRTRPRSGTHAKARIRTMTPATQASSTSTSPLRQEPRNVNTQRAGLADLNKRININ
ncbi:hypothetical protein EVG20_g2762 [Dentipellis fragilis]|uniref:Secreted protein n=1 Tax=Dentipellis fragilis TaxID=205917 RepID=A0A4Y9Z685_9AGAM|nr:hypothetical protein EVG20_g2762 [Dentipellis fragilis]